VARTKLCVEFTILAKKVRGLPPEKGGVGTRAKNGKTRMGYEKRRQPNRVCNGFFIWAKYRRPYPHETGMRRGGRKREAANTPQSPQPRGTKGNQSQEREEIRGRGVSSAGGQEPLKTQNEMKKKSKERQ